MIKNDKIVFIAKFNPYSSKHLKILKRLKNKEWFHILIKNSNLKNFKNLNIIK